MNNFFRHLFVRLLARNGHTTVIDTRSTEQVNSVFIIFPENEEDVKNSVSIITDLVARKKKITVLIHGEFVRFIPNSYALMIKEYFPKDKLFGEIPKQNIKNLINSQEADLLLNLNRNDEIFTLLCTSLVSAPVKFGFRKEFSDRFFNLQFASNSSDSYNSFSNFKSYLYKLIKL
ncbi:MAG: glycosyltransferase family 9 protein [Ignavibacteriales bacterium]|nr:glycosyltransferase family 9 protein [Ignavibacteriales bacterium]HPO55785.1 hypothetical protein [Ignavibacteriaceae bacterium]